MNDVFREMVDSSDWSRIGAIQSPFFEEKWEHVLTTAFPYIRLRHFIYRGTHVMRCAQIGDRVTSAPFSDGGDVIALSDAPLVLDVFRADLIGRFGTTVMVRVHEHIANVTPTEESADIIDFKIDLASFSIDSVRKTLRHILEEDLPHNVEIRSAVSGDIERVYELYLSTMHEAGGIALPRGAFDDLMQRDVFVFVSNRRIEGISVFFSDNASAYHFISASSQVGKQEHAPHHLLFHAIKHYQEMRKTSLFLGGTNAFSSLRTFKEGWRGEECHIYTVSGSVSTHESARRSPLRALWKLVPVWLLPWATKIIGRRVF